MTLSNCGFAPVYGTHAAEASVDLGNVEIMPIEGREGQVLHIALEDKFNPAAASGTKAYHLNASIEVEEIPLIINPDGTAARYRLLIKSPFTLTDAATGKEVYRDKVWQSVSYDVSDADYSTYVASRDARERGIATLSDDYVARISAFLSRSAEASQP